jgi:beta-galactosidase
MKKIIYTALMPVLLASVSFCTYAQASARTIQDFDNNWKFYWVMTDDAKDISFNDASWRNLNLPHDWSY